MLVIHKPVYQRYWRNNRGRGKSRIAETFEKNAQLFKSLTLFQKSMIITACVEKMHYRSSAICIPNNKGFMLLTSGECEVYYNEHDHGPELGKLQDDLNTHHYYGHESAKNKNDANVQKKQCESPIKRRLEKTRKKVPPTRFKDAEQSLHIVKGLNAQKDHKRPSRELIGLVGPGFTLDGSGLPPGYSLKSKSTTEFMYLPYESYHAFTNHSTRLQLSTCRHELLQHLVLNHKAIRARKDAVSHSKNSTPLITRIEDEGAKPHRSSSPTSDTYKSKAKKTGFKLPSSSTGTKSSQVVNHVSVKSRIQPYSAASGAEGVPTKKIVNVPGFDSSMSSKSRFNYSRAGMRSDWKFRASSTRIASDRKGQEDVATGPGILERESLTLPMMPMLAPSDRGEDLKSSETQKLLEHLLCWGKKLAWCVHSHLDSNILKYFV